MSANPAEAVLYNIVVRKLDTVADLLAQSISGYTYLVNPEEESGTRIADETANVLNRVVEILLLRKRVLPPVRKLFWQAQILKTLVKKFKLKKIEKKSS